MTADAAPFFQGKNFVHWVAYNIPKSGQSLPGGLAGDPVLKTPVAITQGMNSTAQTGYFGPRPPAGSGVHHYHFRVYALDKALKLAPKLDKDQLLSAMKGHILAEGEIVGTYESTK